MHKKAIIYGARWKSHECPTGALSISEELPCLSDENKIVPTEIPSLYAFLTLPPGLGAKVRKAYRLEIYVGAILFSSHKYGPSSGMLRYLVGHSCDFQRAR